MRTRLVGGVIVCAVLTEMALLACSKQSFNDYPGDGGDASKDGAHDVAPPFGDDVSDDFPLTPIEAGEASGPPCTMPAGTYTVTYTPTGDAGADDGGACFATTSTFVYPPPTPDGGSSKCLYTSQGDLPICSIAFTCIYDDGQYTTHNDGFIQVLNGSFGGQDTKEIFLDSDASFSVVSCQYTLDYTKQ
jgi:hypothetical protein